MTRVIAFLVHNWPLKVAAIMLATLLYGVIVLTQDSRQIPVTVPIVPRAGTQPADVKPITALGDVRRIRYFAPDSGVQVTSSSFTASVDFSSVTVRKGQVRLGVSVEAIDPRITVLEWEPREISVTVDEIITRSVAVRAVRVGEVPDGLDLRPPVLGASDVDVRGASGVVALVNHVEARYTIEPSAIDIDRDIDLVPVDTDGNEVQEVDVEPSAVRVQVAVFRDAQTKTVPVTPAVTGDPAPGFEIASVVVRPAVVNVEGDAEILDTLQNVDTAQISVSGATETIERTIGLDLPPDIVPIGRSTVQVTVTLRPVSGSRTFGAGIALEGPRNDRTYDLSVDRILVTIGGSVADLDRLEGQAFSVQVAVAGLDVGSHEVQISANLPAGLTLVIASPPTVIVTIGLPAPSGSAAPSPSPSPSP